MPAGRNSQLSEGNNADEVQTYIFVDVDGVLNIGARDDAGGAPLLFSDTNIEQAEKMVQNGGPNATHDCVQKLLSVNQHRVGEEPLSKLASSGPAGVSPVLAQRLAEIVRAAGPRCTTVLSSSWRRPQHKSRALRLEQELSRHMGTKFTFDERTPLRDDSSAPDRLRCIGDFLRERKSSLKGNVRLLILEDFFITPLKGGWTCNGARIDSAEAAEKYLLNCLPESVTGTAKLVHTYDRWFASSGLQVEAGVGLTMEHFNKALDFLSSGTPSYLSENATLNAVFKEMSKGVGKEKAGYVAAGSSIRAAKVNILADPQAQRRWLECLSMTVPWLSLSSMWSL